MNRSPEMQEVVDTVALKLGGRTLTECHKKKLCSDCGRKVDMDSFRDELSKKEYSLSGFCQKCQDNFFGV